MPLRYLEGERLDRIYEIECRMVELHAALSAWLEGIPVEAARRRVRAEVEAAIAAALADEDA
jgi:hypothetical protein